MPLHFLDAPHNGCLSLGCGPRRFSVEQTLLRRGNNLVSHAAERSSLKEKLGRIPSAIVFQPHVKTSTAQPFALDMSTKGRREVDGRFLKSCKAALKAESADWPFG